MTPSEKDEERPLPPRRLHQDTFEEPHDHLAVREEIKGRRRCVALHPPREVDPSLHGFGRRYG